ncbi:phosphatase PAP2 family protein [Geminisphaera colitermitum]|uniref:phosphatase PAP2 family protein n=1 Tax=Geminisphaera colitermitum TaxID=1148786 RepID=UPI000158D52E|nr:phosphatase PAP2 family protein [Geminisphaera colitermitum]
MTPPPPPPLFRPRVLVWSIVALVAVIALFDLTYLDLAAQDMFYNFDTGLWLIDSRATPSLGKLVFYSGIKAVIIAFAVVLLVLVVLPDSLRDRLPCRFAAWRRRDMLVVIATLATAPLLVSIGKATTNIHYPCSIQRYGGDVPYVRLFERFPDDARPPKRSKGFPAGHASGGFALVSLAGLAATRRGRAIGLAIGLGTGWMMGLYQQMRGVHYLSHTLVTMLVCWIVFLLWRMVADAFRLPRQ